MPRFINHCAYVCADIPHKRLDQVAAHLFPGYSRSCLQRWIKSGELTVNGERGRPRDTVFAGDRLQIQAADAPVSTSMDDAACWQGEAIPLFVVHEDEALLIIDKPAGLVVHPAAGHHSGTLLNALLHYCPNLASMPRAGIIHRLDKDTTGLMVVAKTVSAQYHLAQQLQQRTMRRDYEAICQGMLTGGGTVDAPIGRHSKQRIKMAVLEHGGKAAITHYRVIQRFAHYTHIRCMLETGRTHQIRVHMAYIRHPLLGDPLYAGRPYLPRRASARLIDTLHGFHRQALHARQLSFVHPLTDKPCTWEAPLPEDLVEVLAVLTQEDFFEQS